MNNKVINPFQNQRPTYSDVEIKMMKNQTLSQMWEHLGDIFRKMNRDTESLDAYVKSSRYLKEVIELAESQIEK